MNSLWTPEWGGQEIIQQQLQQQQQLQHRQRWQQWAWERRRERERVCVWEWESLSESEFLCTVPSEAEPCRCVASCVFQFGSRALCWGRAYRKGEMLLHSELQLQWRPAPCRGITQQHGRTTDPLLTPAWLMMTAHAWVTMRHSRAALGGNTAMWKWLGCQQLLDMFSRAKSGFLSVFELVFFLLVLSGCPQLTYQARTKGRWNKGGKWWRATLTNICDVHSDIWVWDVEVICCCFFNGYSQVMLGVSVLNAGWHNPLTGWPCLCSDTIPRSLNEVFLLFHSLLVRIMTHCRSWGVVNEFDLLFISEEVMTGHNHRHISI